MAETDGARPTKRIGKPIPKRSLRPTFELRVLEAGAQLGGITISRHVSPALAEQARLREVRQIRRSEPDTGEPPRVIVAVEQSGTVRELTEAERAEVVSASGGAANAWN